MSVHEWAAEGFTRAASAYERARPSYPEAAVAFLVEALGLRRGTTVVDVGAGTGKLARLLVPSGAHVVAVEPVAAMRALVRFDIETLAGTAESLPLGDGVADAAVAAQAVHWFANEAAQAELHRVLRADGALALVDNRRDADDPLQRALAEIVRRHRSHPSLEREHVLDPRLFTVTAAQRFAHEHALAAADLPALVCSETSIALLEAEAAREARRDVERLAASVPERVRLRYVTEVTVARRTPTPRR
jgi:ubiquinone/menaquinone biosynthesis C-methylase UbiE